ncbi:MAG TPA: PadR family transcriptional regulator [Thermoanaerobaculia bacterium]|jgi:transcriptional regulator|nr:PadR family transcriptional regulator [Thermoanaerobaculia bacterium]
MTRTKKDVLQGTLDMLILRVLIRGPMHGYGIGLRIEEVSREALRVEEGSLYPALHRMEQEGWIRATWGTSENNRRAKFYEITPQGERQLEIEDEQWNRLTAAVRQVMRFA